MIKLFISYAHEDEKYKEELEKHLKPLQRNGVVESWNDREILPGVVWENEIKTELEEADVILFLISPDFVASEYIHDNEIKKALDRYENKEVINIPIIVRPTDFSYSEISKFQALPKDGKPITTWSNVDEAWHNVAVQLRRVFDNMNSQGKIHNPTTYQNPTNSKAPSYNDQSNLKSQILNFVAQSKLDKAIKSLMDFANATDNSDLLNSSVLISARLKNLKKNEMQGMISNSDANIQRAQITSSILSLKDDL